MNLNLAPKSKSLAKSYVPLDATLPLPPSKKPSASSKLPDKSSMLRLEKPLLIKYVPQMTMTGFKDYIALIKWCSYTPDKVITIPKDKILTITNASTEMASSYFNIATNYDQKPMPVRQQNYKTQRFTDEENDKVNELFDEIGEDDFDKTIH